ncbi:MAG: recombinase A [Acidobacteriota bacterium]|nr:recombinase A [Acidobacteriota bacterium]
MSISPSVLASTLPSTVHRGLEAIQVPAEWKLAALTGRFAEISGGQATASLTLVFQLVLEAQRQAEPVVWIGHRQSVFFPPDAARAGVDLEGLPVVWAPDDRAAARATDYVLRSGAFGLVLLDLGARPRLPISVQTRLAGLAKHHGTALLCITEKEDRQPSVGSLISLRAHSVRSRRPRPEAADRFLCELQVLKDKRRGPGWHHEEVCRGPEGLL